MATGDDAHGKAFTIAGLVPDITTDGQLDIATGEDRHVLQVGKKATARNRQHQILVGIDQADTQVTRNLLEPCMVTRISQQQRSIHLHTQGLRIGTGDAAQCRNAEVLADVQRRSRAVRDIGDIPVTANTRRPTATEMRECQRRYPIQERIPANRRINTSLGVDDQWRITVDPQPVNRCTITNLLCSQHLACGIEHLDVTRRRCEPHGQRGLIADLAIFQIGQAHGVLLFKAPQILARDQRDIAPQYHGLHVE